jgi:hypothetical protein
MGRFTLCVFMVWGFSVGASDIREHAAVTTLAIEQFEKCFPKKLSAFTRQNLIFSDVEEDINLIQKWVQYSHYYNPKKDLSTWRGTSMNRVDDAQNYLMMWRRQPRTTTLSVQYALTEIGHIIHHIQDSSVPSHVVPVKHWLHDAFENYNGTKNDISISCAEIANQTEPIEQLKTSATETLTSLQKNFEGQKNGQKINLSWDYFWFSVGDKFGSYGYFGNNFGINKIIKPKGVYEVSTEVYNQFWNERRRQSIRNTAQIFYWFFSAIPSGNPRYSSEGAKLPKKSIAEILFDN